MEQARSSWNDDRLDRLSGKVDTLERRMDERFDSLNEALNARFDALHRTLVLSMTSILVAFATLIATQA